MITEILAGSQKSLGGVFWFLPKKEIRNTKTRFEFWSENSAKIIEDATEIISVINSQSPGLFLIPEEILNKYLPSPKKYREHCLDLKTNQEIRPNEIVEYLIQNGYEIADTASETGYYARKGGVIEYCGVGIDHHRPVQETAEVNRTGQCPVPTRIIFNANVVEKIELFDPKSKKTLKKLDETIITPIKLLQGKDSVLRFIEENHRNTIIRDESEGFQKTKTEQIVFNLFAKGQKTYDFLPASLYYGNLQLLKADFEKLQNEKYKFKIFTKQQDQISIILGNMPVEFVNKEIRIPIGYIDARNKQVVLSDKEIFAKTEEISKPGKIDHNFISSLKSGDYIVHVDHGIGKFIGMRKHVVDEGEREYFVLEYAEGDRLSVPVEYADKLDRYVGKSNPAVHRLHGARWNQAKRKIKAATREIAGELLKIYALRQAAQGHQYLGDTPEQIELERLFPYEDTPGQRKVTAEIKQDMESNKPMDRLLVGDVGYGKTEISLRAAFKAVQSKKQVAFLCPTTVLAEQHGQTYAKRFKNFPTKVEVLSRFKTPAQQRKIIEKLKTGEVDIVIGTHRLLSKDIGFKNLGLIILDEEQRFGVEHKEKLKKLRANVDVLTMTATPIPRTLHFSLSGIRDISTIDTPPPGRQPIDTHIDPYSEKEIAKAIRAELARKGQIYFLHNRVETIEAFTKQMQALVPEAKFCIGHGQLTEKQLEQVMEDFLHQKYDVLVCSTIIESGLDIKNVNTLIVDDATKFGLSQLYQLRGRIGRGSVKAHAQFFYKSKKLKGRAKDRLQALLEARELGAGFKIAMRDMEIRGAGNLLGSEQHGSINAIGLSLYSRLLHQAVEEMKTGETEPTQLDISIDLPIDAYIPENFFASEEVRLRTYRELASLSSQDKLNSAIGKLVSNSRSCYTKRDLPKSTLNLISILELKLLCQKHRILSIDTMIKHKPDGTKPRFLNIVFAEELGDKKFWDIFASKIDGWETKDDRTIRIEMERLGEDWMRELKNILE